MMSISNLPLTVINEALRWYGEPPATERRAGFEALTSAESRMDLRDRPPGGLSPLSFALAQYLNLSGPWDEETGEHAGESGCKFDIA